jgi:hypothetical protein
VQQHSFTPPFLPYFATMFVAAAAAAATVHVARGYGLSYGFVVVVCTVASLSARDFPLPPSLTFHLSVLSRAQEEAMFSDHVDGDRFLSLSTPLFFSFFLSLSLSLFLIPHP